MNADGPRWRAELERAFELLATGQAYADDGAYLTAADRLEKAAAAFRDGHRLREVAIAEAAKRPAGR